MLRLRLTGNPVTSTGVYLATYSRVPPGMLSWQLSAEVSSPDDAVTGFLSTHRFPLHLSPRTWGHHYIPSFKFLHKTGREYPRIHIQA